MNRNNQLLAVVILTLLACFTSDAQAVYHPKLGRWMQQDPLGRDTTMQQRLGTSAMPTNAFAPSTRLTPTPGGGYHDGMSLYEYVRSDATNRLDPRGQDAWSRAGKWLPQQWPAWIRCPAIEAAIRTRVSGKGRRAWNRFVSGTGKDITLSSGEMDRALATESSGNLIRKMMQLKKECKKTTQWKGKKSVAEGCLTTGTWAGAIGGMEVHIESDCKCGCLKFTLSINDEYDFKNMIAPHRSWKADYKTSLVRMAQVFSGCGWEEFFHKGSTKIQWGCKK
jgi:hypothetical protein